MVALKKSLPRLLRASKEPLLPDHDPIDEKNLPVLDRSKLDLDITANSYKSLKSGSTHPCPETEAKVKISCVNCPYEDEAKWQGRIIGRGIHGSLNALLTRIKHKSRASKRHTPLMGLLTICVKCREDPDWYYDADQLDQIVGKTSGSLILGLLDEEVEEVISSKAIVMEGVLMNVVQTIGIDGQWNEWDMLRPLFGN